MATPLLSSRTLRGAAKLRQALFSAAPVASGYERDLRPSLARFSRPEGPICSKGDR
jgi:hypothetical protein